MATTSANLGLNLPENTDVFDNDLYLKGNLQKLDDTVLHKNKSVKADGQQMEIVEITIVSGGTSYTINGNATFAKTYTTPPAVSPMYVVQPAIGYSDTMSYPFINNLTTTGFNCIFKTANVSNNFGAGTFKMKFLVIGS